MHYAKWKTVRLHTHSSKARVENRSVVAKGCGNGKEMFTKGVGVGGGVELFYIFLLLLFYILIAMWLRDYMYLSKLIET